MERDAQGFENPDDFFASSPHSNVNHSGGNRTRDNGVPQRNGTSSHQKHRQSMPEQEQEEEYDDVEDDNDMENDAHSLSCPLVRISTPLTT